MPRVNKLCLTTLLVLVITLLPKILITSTVRVPTNAAVLRQVSEFLNREGFVSTDVLFAGEQSLMSVRGDCLAYIVPISHQGWHQQSIIQQASAGKEAWFLSEGALSYGQQIVFYPLMKYYARLLINNLGVNVDYSPILGIVADPSCRLRDLRWPLLPGVPFRKGS